MEIYDSSSVEVCDVLPEGYDGRFALFDDMHPIDVLLSRIRICEGEALLVYWPESLRSCELDSLCDDNRFRNIIGCNGDGQGIELEDEPVKLSRTRPKIYSQDIKDYLSGNWDRLKLNGIKLCVFYERDVAMDAFYDGSLTDILISLDGNPKDNIIRYHKALEKSLSKNIISVSYELSEFLYKKGIATVVLDDLHDFFIFRRDDRDTLDFGMTIDVGRFDPLNQKHDSRDFLARYHNLAGRKYSSVMISGVNSCDGIPSEYRPVLIMSNHVDLGELLKE